MPKHTRVYKSLSDRPPVEVQITEDVHGRCTVKTVPETARTASLIAYLRSRVDIPSAHSLKKATTVYMRSAGYYGTRTKGMCWTT